MNLKEIEKLAKSEDLDKAMFCHYLMDFCKEYWEDEKDAEDLEPIKEWDELTDAEKEDLIEQAMYFWTKDESGASICKICNCVMINQPAILANEMDKWDFLEELAWFD